MASVLAASRCNVQTENGPQEINGVTIAPDLKSGEILVAVDTLIRLTSQTEETEAIVRRAAVAALTRLPSVLFEPEDWRRVVNAMKLASTTDFDFDVKRLCVAFWTKASEEATLGSKTNRNDVDGEPEAKSQKICNAGANEEFVGVLMSMAKTDEDLSVKRCAKEALDRMR